MMIKKSTKFRLLIAALLLITGDNLFSQEVTWDFPVKPGMEEWRSLKSRSERAKACQIPDDVLTALSTEGLIELCLSYPFIIDIRAFDNILSGFNKYSGEFNGFQELIKRTDAASVLIKKYKEKDPLAIEKDWSSYDKYDYALKISMMELFLCNKDILSKMGNGEKKDLMNEYRLKKSQKNKMCDLYKRNDFQTIYLAIVKLLESENVDLSRDMNMDIVSSFITTGILRSRDVFKEINNAVINYLLTFLKPISEESTYYEDHCQELFLGQYDVYTPKGTRITADHPGEEYDNNERLYWDNYWSGLYPEAIKINTYGGYSSTTMFNCHGYAWHVSERGLSNPAEYRKLGSVYDQTGYWEDGSYEDIESITYPWHSNSPDYPGKVSYSPLEQRDHSAVIANPDTYSYGWVISKWADGPLMCHAPEECPYADTTIYSLTLDCYRLNPNHITGAINPPLCKDTERTFSTDITHLPQALTWSKSGPIAFLRQTDSTYTVKGSGIGSVKVKLEILTLTGFTWSDSIQFQAIDKPLISNQMVDGSAYYYGIGVSPGSHILSFLPYPDNGSTTETWTVPSGIQYHIYQGEHKLGFYFLTNPSLTFTVKATNACGTGPVSTYYLTRQRGYIMTLYPNPASDNVTITMIEKIPSTEYCDTTGFISETITDTYTQSVESTTFTIRIYNSQSELLYTCERSGKSFNIPLVNMKDGIYIIEVSEGETYYRQQLIIKHN